MGDMNDPPARNTDQRQCTANDVPSIPPSIPLIYSFRVQPVFLYRLRSRLVSSATRHSAPSRVGSHRRVRELRLSAQRPLRESLSHTGYCSHFHLDRAWNPQGNLQQTPLEPLE